MPTAKFTTTKLIKRSAFDGSGFAMVKPAAQKIINSLAPEALMLLTISMNSPPVVEAARAFDEKAFDDILAL
jgi:hypothetical protein